MDFAEFFRQHNVTDPMERRMLIEYLWATRIMRALRTFYFDLDSITDKKR